jgi:hypothetical protein
MTGAKMQLAVSIIFIFCAFVALNVDVLDVSGKTPLSPVFYKTENSDEWVSHTLHIQQRYTRVLVVDASGHRPQIIGVAALNLNSRENEKVASAHQYKVHAVFKTLQEAADVARGGDLIAVMPGAYAGFVVEDKRDAGDWRYIHFKAMGKRGEVTINRSSRDPDWMILLQAAHHVIVQGFNIAGSTGPGLEPKGPRAGIMLDGISDGVANRRTTS